MNIKIKRRESRFNSSPFLLLSVIACTGWLSCERDLANLNGNTSIDKMVISAEKNDGLEEDLILEIRDDSIVGHLPLDVNLKNLIVDFEVEKKAELFIKNKQQNSGKTAVDFSKPFQYKVVAQNNDQKIYHVTVTYFTSLPIMYLNTNDNTPVVSRDEYKDATVRMYGGLQFSDLEQQDVRIRGRGNSTWSFPKKPYQIRFEDKTSVLDQPEDRRWILLTNYSDKTMLRNTLAFQLGQMSDLVWTPNDEPIELFLNNEYVGTYLLTQKVEVTKNRLSLSDDGFLLEADQPGRLDEDDVYVETDRLLFNVKEPNIEFDDRDYDYIQNYLQEVETAIYGTNFKDANNGYAKYLDVESFVDWYLIHEITKNVDSRFYTSVFLHHERGGKLKMGPIWDFDLAFGNVDYADSRYVEGFWIKDSPWMERLFEDPAFVEKVKERYQYYYKNKANLVSYLYAQAKQLNLAQQANDDRWQTIGIYVWPNPVVLESYKDEVDFVADWLEERMDWLAVALNEL
ncbi:MAG: CotH kinase family protein [Bacteroidota bacterium]